MSQNSYFIKSIVSKIKNGMTNGEDKLSLNPKMKPIPIKKNYTLSFLVVGIIVA